MNQIFLICITASALHLKGGESRESGRSDRKAVRQYDVEGSDMNDFNVCICTLELAPVCGSDGETYGNANCARCHVSDYTEGPCEKDRDKYPDFMFEEPKPDCCDTTWDPVCGTDGTTYSNANCAVCKGSEVAFDGMCNSITPHCVCSTDWDAVCGIPAGGELTGYANLCVSKCQSAPVKITDVDMDDCVGSSARTMVLLPD